MPDALSRSEKVDWLIARAARRTVKRNANAIADSRLEPGDDIAIVQATSAFAAVPELTVGIVLARRM